MEKYDTLLDEIKEYLNKDEINYNTNNEIISAYDLYNIINKELEGLRNIQISSQINKRLKNFFIFNSSTNFYTKLMGDESTCTLCIEESMYDEPYVEFLNIYKDKDINEIYMNKEENCFNKKMFKFMKKNYNLILETLQTLEDYVELLGNLNTCYYRNTEIKDDLFKIEFQINYMGVVEYKISILDTNDLFEEYNKKWYKREGIYEFANNNVESI